MLAFIATSVKILVSIAACTCKTNCYVMLLEKAPVMMVIAGAPLPLLGPSQWTPCLTSRSEGGWPAVRKSSRKCVLKLWLKSSDPTWLTRLAQSALPLTQKQTVSCSTGAFTGITVCVCVCVCVSEIMACVCVCACVWFLSLKQSFSNKLEITRAPKALLYVMKGTMKDQRTWHAAWSQSPAFQQCLSV